MIESESDVGLNYFSQSYQSYYSELDLDVLEVRKGDGRKVLGPDAKVQGQLKSLLTAKNGREGTVSHSPHIEGVGAHWELCRGDERQCKHSEEGRNHIYMKKKEKSLA